MYRESLRLLGSQCRARDQYVLLVEAQDLRTGASRAVAGGGAQEGGLEAFCKPHTLLSPVECIFHMLRKTEDHDISFHFPVGTCSFRPERRPLMRGTARLGLRGCLLGSYASGCKRKMMGPSPALAQDFGLFSHSWGRSLSLPLLPPSSPLSFAAPSLPPSSLPCPPPLR